MPFQIIREDITKMQCDAIVNPTNEMLYPGGGVDAAIHEAAGTELLEMCQNIGGLDIGKAKITPAYNLPCKYVIHTVGPLWEDGKHNEEALLQSCYKEALKIAKATKCASVAFPLISSGAYGYPKDQVLKVALEVIKEFLYENDMLVYIVIFDKTVYALDVEVTNGVTAYIDRYYEGDINEDDEDITPDSMDMQCLQISRTCCADICERRMEKCAPLPDEDWYEESVPKFGSISALEKFMYKGFRDTLIDFLEEKNMDDVACYKRANVSRQTWHKIMTDKGYKPTKKTAIALAISLELNLDKAQELLVSAGFILSKSSLFDVIIMFCIVKGIYDVFEVDSILFQYDQETLFSIK